MIGNNQLKLNHSQMQEALEAYLKEYVFKDDKFVVSDVSENKSNGYFYVALEGQEDAIQENK